MNFDTTLNYNMHTVYLWDRGLFLIVFIIKFLTRQSASFSWQPALICHLISLSNSKTISHEKTRIRAYGVARRRSLLAATEPTFSLLPLSSSTFALGSKKQWRIQRNQHAFLKSNSPASDSQSNWLELVL